MATKQSQIRLTDEDKAKIEAIRERMGLPSASSAIRYAVETMYREMLRREIRAEGDVNKARQLEESWPPLEG